MGPPVTPPCLRTACKAMVTLTPRAGTENEGVGASVWFALLTLSSVGMTVGNKGLMHKMHAVCASFLHRCAQQII